MRLRTWLIASVILNLALVLGWYFNRHTSPRHTPSTATNALVRHCGIIGAGKWNTILTASGGAASIIHFYLTTHCYVMNLSCYGNLGSADKLVFTGSVAGGNDVLLQDTHFDLAAATGTTLKDGASWDILDWSNLVAFQMIFSGDLASYFNLPTLGEGQSWGFDRFASHGVIYVVPEPSRAVLLLTAFALVHLRRRRR